MINNTMSLHYFEKIIHLRYIPLSNGFECAMIDLRYFILMNIIEKLLLITCHLLFPRDYSAM